MAKGKRLSADKLETINLMLERGVKVSEIAEAVECSDKTIYAIRSGRYHKQIAESYAKIKPKEQGDPICENSKCFACRVDFGRGRCIALNNTDFGGRKCPFFKTRERMDFEERKTNIRLEELGMRGAVYE